MLRYNYRYSKKKTHSSLRSVSLSLALFLALSAQIPHVPQSFSITNTNTIFAQKAYAEGAAFKIYPSTLQIRAESPSDARAPLIVENQSNQPVKMKIRYRVIDTANSKEGNITFLNVGDLGPNPKVFDYIQIVDSENVPLDSLDLGPKQKKQLQLRVQIPAGQPSSDNYFSLIFLHDILPQNNQSESNKNKDSQHSITTLQGGVAANVFLAIGDRETALGTIEEFSTPWYHQSGPIPFNIKVKNSGLHYINPKGVIYIKNIFGQTVGKVDIPSTTILKGTTRTLSDTESIALATPNAAWSEKFLLGFYSATLSMDMSENGPTYTQSVRFAVFPVLLITLFFMVAGIFVAIIVKLKKRKKRHYR